MRFRPTTWADMPQSARKCILRTARSVGWCPSDPRLNGFEWIATLAEPDKVYAQSRGGRWYVASGVKHDERLALGIRNVV